MSESVGCWVPAERTKLTLASDFSWGLGVVGLRA